MDKRPEQGRRTSENKLREEDVQKDPNQYRVVFLMPDVCLTASGTNLTTDHLEAIARAESPTLKEYPHRAIATTYRGLMIKGNLFKLGIPNGARLQVGFIQPVIVDASIH